MRGLEEPDMRNAARTRAHPDTISRRELLEQIAGLSLGLPLSRAGLLALPQASRPRQKAQQQPTPPKPWIPPVPSTLSAEDDQFLNELEHANFLFFWEQANPETGLIKDRCNVR